nr:hypothetical protein Iba_chr06bCG12340 [Ipomoea batatas]
MPVQDTLIWNPHSPLFPMNELASKLDERIWILLRSSPVAFLASLRGDCKELRRNSTRLAPSGLRAGKRSLIRISDFTAFFGWELASLAQSTKAFSNGFEDKFSGEVPSASTSFLCAVYLESLANDGKGCAKISSILVDLRVKLTNQPGHVGHSATRKRRRTGGGCERRECETEERIR